jgi:hypothetical protein
MSRYVRSLIGALFLLATFPAFGQREWIPDYHSDIVVQSDGSMMVREFATSNQIELKQANNITYASRSRSVRRTVELWSA